MQHQVLHLHPWLLLLLQCCLGFHVPGHRQLQPWEVSPEFLLNWCHPLGCLALRHPSCIPSLPTRGGGRGVRTLGTGAWGSRGIWPGSHRNVRFLLENSSLGRDCWLLFDVPLQRKHCWWALSTIPHIISGCMSYLTVNQSLIFVLHVQPSTCSCRWKIPKGPDSLSSISLSTQQDTV